MKIEKYNDLEVMDDTFIKLLLHDEKNNLYEVKYYPPFDGHGPFETIINNEIYTFDFTHIYPKIISKEKLLINIVGFSGVKIKDKIYPVSIDNTVVFKHKEDYSSDVMDTLWLVLSGEAGDTIDKVIKFIEERVTFEEENQDVNTVNATYNYVLSNYIHQYYSSTKVVKYHPEMKLASLNYYNNKYTLQIGTNDKRNLVYKYEIFKSFNSSTKRPVVVITQLNFKESTLQVNNNILLTNNNILNVIDFISLFKDPNVEIKVI